MGRGKTGKVGRGIETGTALGFGNRKVVTNISNEKVRSYQSELNTLADSIDFAVKEDDRDKLFNRLNITLSNMASEIRNDPDLSEEDRRMMRQRIKRMREVYL